MTTIRIKADDENNADVFWGEIDERFPRIAAELRVSGVANVTPTQWKGIQQLPGFADGPDHAREALIVVGISMPHITNSDYYRNAGPHDEVARAVWAACEAASQNSATTDVWGALAALDEAIRTCDGNPVEDETVRQCEVEVAKAWAPA